VGDSGQGVALWPAVVAHQSGPYTVLRDLVFDEIFSYNIMMT
jgi:hypothetical protein